MDPCATAHHWLIETRPAGGSYHATCKVCGEERDFPQNTARFKYHKTGRTSPSSATPDLVFGSGGTAG
jgi:hypothetical protein